MKGMTDSTQEPAAAQPPANPAWQAPDGAAPGNAGHSNPSSAPAQRPAWRPQLIVVLVTLACLVPFLNKAYHMDDTLFLWIARHLGEHVTNFFGFNANWYGYAMPMHQIMQNPPGGAYFIAAAAALGGWGEVWLHSAFLLPAIAVGLGTFRLGRRLSSRPMVGALCAVLTPAFVVSATNIMADVLMLACYTWAIAFWVEGLEDRRPGFLLLASLLIATAALTKYFGISLIPLLGVYSWLYHRKQAAAATACLVVPVIILGWFELYASGLYGHGLVFGAFDYSTLWGTKHATLLQRFQRLGTGLSFLGGGLIGTVLFIPWLWPRRQWLWGVGLYVLVALAGAALFAKYIIVQGKWSEGSGWWFRAQYLLFVGVGLHLLALAVIEFWRQRDAPSFLLLSWLLGTFAFAAVLNWTVSVRALLPLTPAAGILIARRLGRQAPSQPSGCASPGVPALAAVLVACALISGAVAAVDYAWAGSMRAMASKLYPACKTPANTVYYQGHWGFQYYMDAAGGVAVDLTSLVLRPDDMVINPWDNCNVRTLKDSVATREASFPVIPCRWLTVGNGFAGASFYSSAWGPLPWYVGPAPPLSYEVFRVR
jgi:4-amino-4-deoxy-L-arabinose transferase-like glycosyltransferase